jgi:tetratricopeptide (TPR) repeat protein
LRHWQAAGQQAINRSAAHEALKHFEAALGILPKTSSDQVGSEVELAVQMQLADAVLRAEGYSAPRIHDCFVRARDLAKSLPRPDEYLRACSGVAADLGARGRLREAISMLESVGPDVLLQARPMGRVSRLVRRGWAHMLCGELALAEADLIESRHELEQVPPADHQPIAGSDPLLAILVFLCQDQRYRGRLVEAESNAREALGIANEKQLAHGRVLALRTVGELAAIKGKSAEVIAYCTEGIELATRYGVKAHGAHVTFTLGNALVTAGQTDAGIKLMRKGFQDWRTFGGRFWSTNYAVSFTESLLDAGQREEALTCQVDGEKTMQESDEKYQAARFFCLRARFAELDGDVDAAEAAYRSALHIAHQQGALLYALGAAAQYAQLLQSQRRAKEAGAVLRPIYDQFTETFDWPDLVRAKALLALCE